MAVKYVHKTEHEMYSYSKDTVLSFPRVHWQGVKLIIHFHLLQKL
jgi:hypothetical protein